MPTLQNERLSKITDVRKAIFKDMRNTNSQLTANVDRALKYAALAMNSVLTGSGDYDLPELERIIAELFEPQRVLVQTASTALNDIGGLRVLDGQGNIDLAATQAAFTTFVAKYSLDLVAISDEYNEIT